MKQLIAGIIIALLAVVFALQNSEPVFVKLIIGDPLSISLALVIIVTLIIGLIAGMLFLAPGVYRRNKIIQSQKDRISVLENDIAIKR